jgi:hypothetical protein
VVEVGTTAPAHPLHEGEDSFVVRWPANRLSDRIVVRLDLPRIAERREIRALNEAIERAGR